MAITADFLDHLKHQGTVLHGAVLARDDAHLGPTRFTAAAASRLRAGIAAMESWLRRVLILLALHLEPDLPAGRPYAKVHRPRRFVLRSPAFRIFSSGRELDIDARDAFRRAERFPTRGSPVWAAPLLARLSALKALIDAPEARARRLAWYLARRRPGPILPPLYRGPRTGRLFGTEAGALHGGLAQAILARSRARPPPLGPLTQLGPRIRAL